MKVFSQNLEILGPCCDVILSELCHKDSNLYIMYNWRKNIKVRNYNNFGSKIFSDGKISEFRNIDPRCDAIIPKLELSGQNLHLRLIFQLFEISEGFNH